MNLNGGVESRDRPGSGPEPPAFEEIQGFTFAAAITSTHHRSLNRRKQIAQLSPSASFGYTTSSSVIFVTMSEFFEAHDPSDPAFYGPSQTALLLLDFHNLLVEKLGGPSAPAALDTAARLRSWAKSRGIVIIATMKGQDGEEAPVLSQDTDTNDHTFLRTPGYVSALQSPGLLDFLRGKGIKSLIMTGLSTSGCVLRTAIPATEADFVVTVVSDACADPVESNHGFLIERILPSRAHVLTASQVLAMYGDRSDA
ncbi:unnamed protein product [Aureobasidium mustum]|uniref:Isochorismatase-like domain-containing protein n=1 Tax=Aureobasidium mustum TaxID=2773714 RepID=A0A9N8K9T8_9PEZI|nr:unnamed protein product [Aureobasidium mustum]